MRSTFTFINLLLLSMVSVQAQSVSNTLKEMEFGERLDKIVFLEKENEFGYIPVSFIKGKYPGKVFTIVSGVHGYEYPPIMAVQEFLSEIQPEDLHGTIIIIPLANVASFYKRSPFVNPVDNKNLNTAFPGKESGSITEKIANWISKEIIPNSHVFLDIHGGDASEDLLPFICYYNNESSPQITQQAKELSEASQMKYIVSYPYNLMKGDSAKYAFKQAVQDDIVALSIEAGKLGTVQNDNVKIIKNAVYNMLEYCSIYKSGRNEVVQAKTYLTNQAYIRVDQRGIFYSNISAGDMVSEGQEVGYITNELGHVLSYVRSPISGIVLYKIGTPPVNVGETLFCIGY